MDREVPPEQVDEFMDLVGAIFRQVVQDLREVLMARASVKRGFRMELTMIQAAENNPLKFSAGGTEEAIDNLLFKHSKGYLSAIDAFKEGFQDIKDHQLAMMSGMQAAFNALLDRFDPDGFEAKLGKAGQKWSWGASGKKAECWDAYSERFREVRKQAEDDFQRIFGDEFTRAYEKQIKMLSSARKKARSG